MKVSLMIEGALGLNWERWKRIVKATEDLGFDGIVRSDHFMGRPGIREDALEAITSLTWAAGSTSRIELGTMVSPISFRDPRILAWQSVSINDLSKGRFRLGLGSGWKVDEHEAFGFELGTMEERFHRLRDGLDVITALTRSTEPVSHASDRFPLNDAQLLPVGHRLPLVIGGNGPKRTLPLVAKYADEWNSLKGSAALFRERNEQLNRLLEEEQRQPSDVRRTQMVGCIIGKDEAALRADPDFARFDELLEKGELVGTPGQIVAQLGEKAEAGVQGVQLQWLDLDDLTGLELIASEVIPQVRG